MQAGAAMNTAVAIMGLGYLGRDLAARLLLQGRSVYSCARSSQAAGLTGIAHALLDLDELVPDHPAMRAWTAAPTWVCLLPPSCSDHYVEKLMLLADWAQACGLRHLIYTSSISVYGSAARQCTVATPVQPETPGARKIVAVEQALLASALPHVSILRLGGLYDDVRHPVRRMAGKTGLPGGAHPVNMIQKAQAVDAILRAMALPAGRRILNVVEKAHPTRREFYTAAAARLGCSPPLFDAGDGSTGKIVI